METPLAAWRDVAGISDSFAKPQAAAGLPDCYLQKDR